MNMTIFNLECGDFHRVGLKLLKAALSGAERRTPYGFLRFGSKLLKATLSGALHMIFTALDYVLECGDFHRFALKLLKAAQSGALHMIFTALD